jgi:hypothetical protein
MAVVKPNGKATAFFLLAALKVAIPCDGITLYEE